MSMTIEECLPTRRSMPVPNVSENVLHQFDMAGKVCVVTGSSRGIGRAISEGLAQAGAHIVTVYSSQRPEVDLMATNMAEKYGIKVMACRCNVTAATEVETLVAEVMRAFGRIDCFIANAGVCFPGSIFEQTSDEYYAQFNVNVHGVYHCAKYAGMVFRDQGFGNFIITSSVSGRVVTVPIDHTVYNTTKAAATQLGRSLAREWRGFARVNIVSPGYISTDMSDLPANTNEACRMAALGREGSVRELMGVYLYLASEASSFVTGAEFTIDGGYTLT